MSRSRPRPRAAAGRGLSPQVVAMSVLVVVLAAVVTIFTFMRAGKPAPQAEEPQVENPFEGLPPERPPAPSEGKGEGEEGK